MTQDRKFCYAPIFFHFGTTRKENADDAGVLMGRILSVLSKEFPVYVRQQISTYESKDFASGEKNWEVRARITVGRPEDHEPGLIVSALPDAQVMFGNDTP
jgi:hypothetical protein